jgi:hypothetical protein
VVGCQRCPETVRQALDLHVAEDQSGTLTARRCSTVVLMEITAESYHSLVSKVIAPCQEALYQRPKLNHCEFLIFL